MQQARRRSRRSSARGCAASSSHSRCPCSASGRSSTPATLLQVDIVFGPRPGPVTQGVSAPASALQWAAVHVLGGELTGKVYAVGTLFLAGFAPMVLFRRAHWYTQTAAGFLGVMNPFVYDRLVDGQWYVVIAAAGLFLWLAGWEALQSRPGYKRAVLLAVSQSRDHQLRPAHGRAARFSARRRDALDGQLA